MVDWGCTFNWSLVHSQEHVMLNAGNYRRSHFLKDLCSPSALTPNEVDNFITQCIYYSVLLIDDNKMGLLQGLLYYRTCKRDFLCSWPSLNSYLK